MPRSVLILGASYGSLLATKLAMAGHNATLVCRDATARLIMDAGTEVRICLKDETAHHSFFSRDMPGRIDAATPERARPADFDLVCLAMQEPQYGHPAIAALLDRIAEADVPCMSIMNMPPPPYLRRFDSLDGGGLEAAFSNIRVWKGFNPAVMTLCSPDPQAFRPEDATANVLHVGLPTNFKAARFGDAAHDAMLDELAADIDAVRVDGKEVPVKLRVSASPYVPFAKWSMLATGNYRCITAAEPISIREAVHDDLERSREIYAFVNEVVLRMGADADDLVPFEKYADAAQGLSKPSSAARAIADEATSIERVDKLIQLVAASFGMENPAISATVQTIDRKIAENRRKAA